MVMPPGQMTVMQMLYWSMVIKGETSHKRKLFCLSFVNLSGNDTWVITKRMWLKLLFSAGWMGSALEVRSSDIWEWLKVEPLPLCSKMSQLRWFSHQARIPPGCFPGRCFRHVHLGGDPQAGLGESVGGFFSLGEEVFSHKLDPDKCLLLPSQC